MRGVYRFKKRIRYAAIAAGTCRSDCSELDFAVLNCGHQLVGFYERVGYEKLSDRALYLRDEELAFDEDPALAISFKRRVDISILKCKAFPFGFDF